MEASRGRTETAQRDTMLTVQAGIPFAFQPEPLPFKDFGPSVHPFGVDKRSVFSTDLCPDMFGLWASENNVWKGGRV